MGRRKKGRDGTKFWNQMLFFLFLSFSTFSKIALSFKENFEIFQSYQTFFVSFFKIFKYRPKFQRKFWKFPIKSNVFLLFFKILRKRPKFQRIFWIFPIESNVFLALFQKKKWHLSSFLKSSIFVKEILQENQTF